MAQTAPASKSADLDAEPSALERAIVIAAEAHAGQLDKGGEPYILHPLRVMAALETEEDRIVGVLHDLVEDCYREWSFTRLVAEGFSPAVVGALVLLTRLKGEPYEDFIARLKHNPIARRVKIADLRDNMNLSRIPHPSYEDTRRQAKYGRALKALFAEAAGPEGGQSSRLDEPLLSKGGGESPR